MRFAPLVCIAALGCAASRPHPAPLPSADAAFWKKMKAGDYAGAAGIADAAKLAPWYVGEALVFAKRKAFRFTANEDARELLSTVHDGPFNRDGLLQEIAIACRYGPTDAARKMASEDAVTAWRKDQGDTILIILAEEDCPIPDAAVGSAVGAARILKRYDLIKKIAARAGMDEDDKKHAAMDVAWTMDCFDGVELGLEFGLSDASLEDVAGRCGIHDPHPMFWKFRDAAQANALFFAAVRQGQLILAFALIPVAESGHEADATEYVCQEAFRGRRDFQLAQSFPHLPRESKDAVITWLIRKGRFRIAGWLTDDPRREHEAFDAAIAAGQYENAGEIALYGVELTFRKTGPLEAFRAAMHAKDFATGRALKYRYAISDDDYWKAYNEAFPESPANQPATAPATPKKRAPPKKPCKDTGDWEVERCKE